MGHELASIFSVDLVLGSSWKSTGPAVGFVLVASELPRKGRSIVAIL
jgi:hypothetical protein